MVIHHTSVQAFHAQYYVIWWCYVSGEELGPINLIFNMEVLR